MITNRLACRATSPLWNSAFVPSENSEARQPPKCGSPNNDHPNEVASQAMWTDNGRRSLHDDACIPTATSHSTALPVARRRPAPTGEADGARATRAPTSGAPLYESGTTRPHIANDCAAGRRLPPARGESHVQWENRAHFFAVAAQLMRRIMIDHARQRHALKRGGGAIRIRLNECAAVTEMRAAELLALDEALEKLAGFDQRKAKVVEMRYFGGLTIEEIADVLKIHVNTVTRDWTAARAWLFAALSGEDMDAV